MVPSLSRITTISCYDASIFGFNHQELSKWVVRQRALYRNKTRGQFSSLTDEKEKMLRDIGFVFNSHKSELPRRSLYTLFAGKWEAKYAELVKFREKNGHVHVPRRRKGCEALGSWAQRQRQHYRLKLAGKPSCLTPYRYNKLKAINFPFSVDGKGIGVPDTEDGSWEELEFNENELYESRCHEANVSDDDEGSKADMAEEEQQSNAKNTGSDNEGEVEVETEKEDKGDFGRPLYVNNYNYYQNDELINKELGIDDIKVAAMKEPEKKEDGRKIRTVAKKKTARKSSTRSRRNTRYQPQAHSDESDSDNSIDDFILALELADEETAVHHDAMVGNTGKAPEQEQQQVVEEDEEEGEKQDSKPRAAGFAKENTQAASPDNEDDETEDEHMLGESDGHVSEGIHDEEEEEEEAEEEANRHAAVVAVAARRKAPLAKKVKTEAARSTHGAKQRPARTLVKMVALKQSPEKPKPTKPTRLKQSQRGVEPRKQDRPTRSKPSQAKAQRELSRNRSRSRNAEKATARSKRARQPDVERLKPTQRISRKSTKPPKRSRSPAGKSTKRRRIGPAVSRSSTETWSKPFNCSVCGTKNSGSYIDHQVHMVRCTNFEFAH